MITLEEFLYLENVIESQATSLIQKYKGLKFESPEDFRNYFDENGVVLKQDTSQSKSDKAILLERFRSFKNSNDYNEAKRYIEDQITIKNKLKEIQKNGGTIQSITNLLSNVEGEPIDPFFNFVVRKILTGSETGTLPSEDLRKVLDKLIQENSKEYYDEQSDVERDLNDRIIDYQNLYKNKGRIRVPILDERFVLSDFRYIIDTSFKSIPNAVSSESNISNKIASIVQELGTGGAGSAGTAGAGAGTSAQTPILNSLSELLNPSSNSVTGLNAKIENLQNQLDIKQKSIDARIKKEIVVEQFIDSIAKDNLKKDITIAELKKTNKNLQEKIDKNIADLQKNVEKQVSQIPNKFDELSKKLEEQNKIAQKQSEALVKALTPPTPADNPAAPIIKEILPLLDKIYAVGFNSGNVDNTTVFANYTKFKELLDKLSIPEPTKTDYLHLFNNFTPAGQELKQIIYFNDQLKPKLKAEVQKLTDKDKATSIKTLMQELVNINSSGPLTLLDVINNTIKDWSENRGQSGGDGVPVIFDLYFELSPTYKRDNNPITRQMIDGNKGAAYTELMTKQPLIPSIKTNPDRLLTVIRLLNKISDVLTQPKNVTSDWTG